MGLEEYTLAQLQAAITARKKQEHNAIIEQRKVACTQWFKHIDALLSLVAHSKISCNDDELRFSWEHDVGCSRCALLSFKRDGWWPSDFVLDLRAVVQFQPIKES